VSDVRQPKPARPGRKPVDQVQAHPLSRALRDLLRASDEVDPSLAKRLDLNPSDYTAMNHLMSGPPALGPVELGTLLGISSSSATGLVDRLESAGHVRRQPHPSDRRRLVVAPTESAIRNVIEVLRPMLDALDALGGEFSEPEQRAIERYLREAAVRLRAYARDLDRSGSNG
jgi:DNA-binding MarR family transcriptional regulator